MNATDTASLPSAPSAPATQTSDSAPAGLDEALANVIVAARRAGRDDLAHDVSIAVERVSRPTTHVAVLGEFKQGKSSLVNALLGRPICPVDDDVATAVVTVLTYGPAERVEIVRRASEGLVTETLPLDRLAETVTEGGNPGNRLRVERATVTLDHPLLAKGITLIDTPGMGGIAAGHAEATLAFLPYADALIFVTDASSELTAPERDWLTTARERCPVVIPVLSKTDLHPSWRRIAELDAGHLNKAGISSTLLSVSATGHEHAVRTNDRDLALASGIVTLTRLLTERVADPARARARTRAVAEARRAVKLIAEATALEVRALISPESSASVRMEIDQIQSRIAHLRGPAARWSQVLADGSADISSSASFRFRGEMRELAHRLDERVEQLSATADWDELARTMQVDVAHSVGEVFAALEQGFARLRDGMEVLVADELGEPAAVSSDGQVGEHLASLWQDRQGPSAEQAGGRSVVASRAGAMLKGTQSGLSTFSFLSQLLPAAAGAILLAGPLTIALGGYFAGKSLHDARKRSLTMKRNQARQAVKVHLDDVQFELSNRLTDLVRTRQRELRDLVTQRLGELQRTYASTLGELTARAEGDATTRSARAGELKGQHGELTRLDKLLSGATGHRLAGNNETGSNDMERSPK
jgi:Dynamin family